MYRKPNSDAFYDFPTIKTDKMPSLGIGGRQDLLLQTGRDSPPPNTYKILTSVDLNKMKKKGTIIAERIKPLVTAELKRILLVSNIQGQELIL
jgi:hypothetical protein